MLWVNYDEKPLYPDQPFNRTLVLEGDTIVAPVANRSKTWTLGIYDLMFLFFSFICLFLKSESIFTATAVNAAGKVLHATILLRGLESIKPVYEKLSALSSVPMVWTIFFSNIYPIFYLFLLFIVLLLYLCNILYCCSTFFLVFVFGSANYSLKERIGDKWYLFDCFGGFVEGDWGH